MAEPLIVDTNLDAFFQTALLNAAENQSATVSHDTLHYLVKLLTAYSRSRNLYQRTANRRLTLQPLALLYADAVNAPSVEQRNQALKKLGDVALFITGLFSASLKRKPVGVDYYIAMGGNAYSCLSDHCGRSAGWRALGEVFDELAAKFTDCVDLLGEVGERAHFSRGSELDLLELYDFWQRSGSRRSAARLRDFGIEPLPQPGAQRRH